MPSPVVTVPVGPEVPVDAEKTAETSKTGVLLSRDELLRSGVYFNLSFLMQRMVVYTSVLLFVCLFASIWGPGCSSDLWTD